jgi:histidinol-phosphatase (PHP family)
VAYKAAYIAANEISLLFIPFLLAPGFLGGTGRRSHSPATHFEVLNFITLTHPAQNPINMLTRFTRCLMSRSILDYHIHDSYSRDAPNATVKKYIQQAEHIGLKELCFTTHFIITGKDQTMGVNEETIPLYVNNIHEASQTTNLDLRVGLEVDYFPSEERRIEKIVEEYSFDYILGSIHYINGVDIGSRRQSPQYFQNRSLSEACDEYYQVTKQALVSGIFDMLAHPDYWRKYYTLIRKTPAKWSEYGEKVYEVIDALRSYDIGFEVNTSGNRHGLSDNFPVIDFIKRAKEAGIKKVTVGSDSHSTSYLGKWIPEALQVLKKEGYTQITTFKNRKPSQNPITKCIQKS